MIMNVNVGDNNGHLSHLQQQQQQQQQPNYSTSITTIIPPPPPSSQPTMVNHPQHSPTSEDGRPVISDIGVPSSISYNNNNQIGHQQHVMQKKSRTRRQPHYRATKRPSSERRFQCEQCESRFFTQKDVKRHMVVHTGVRNFACPFCEHRFGRKDHLVRHAKKSHGQDTRSYKRRNKTTTTTTTTATSETVTTSVSNNNNNSEQLPQPKQKRIRRSGFTRRSKKLTNSLTQENEQSCYTTTASLTTSPLISTTTTTNPNISNVYFNRDLNTSSSSRSTYGLNSYNASSTIFANSTSTTPIGTTVMTLELSKDLVQSSSEATSTLVDNTNQFNSYVLSRNYASNFDNYSYSTSTAYANIYGGHNSCSAGDFPSALNSETSSGTSSGSTTVIYPPPPPSHQHQGTSGQSSITTFPSGTNPSTYKSLQTITIDNGSLHRCCLVSPTPPSHVHPIPAHHQHHNHPHLQQHHSTNENSSQISSTSSSVTSNAPFKTSGFNVSNFSDGHLQVEHTDYNPSTIVSTMNLSVVGSEFQSTLSPVEATSNATSAVAAASALLSQTRYHHETYN